jgi:hypothetical protein
MTKRERLILVFSIIMIVAGTGILIYKNSGSSSKDMLRIDLTTFKTEGGWGYDIHVDTLFFIHQDRIPLIPGNKVFVSEADALKTGQLMVEKIKKKGRPDITMDELKALGIHY